MLFKFVLECAIREVKENQEGSKLNSAFQLWRCVDNVNLLWDDVGLNTIKIAESVHVSSKDGG
jgi:hypothetical protein